MSESTDLFGQKAEVVKNYSAYAGTPGAGKQGMSCKDCAHYTLVHYRSGVYRKCGLNERNWTHGKATDIKARTPSCEKFEQDFL